MIIYYRSCLGGHSLIIGGGRWAFVGCNDDDLFGDGCEGAIFERSTQKGCALHKGR